MKRHIKGMAILSLIASISFMIGLTAILLAHIYPVARNYSESADINNAVQAIRHSSLSNYRFDVLKTRCFHDPKVTTLNDLIAYDSTLEPLVLYRDWQYSFDYEVKNTPYPHPIRLDVTVTFNSKDKLNNVIQYLNPTTSNTQSITFSYPVTKSVSNYEQFDRSAGCIH